MKKQLLTTAAALAMLAPTMTSFAATEDKTIGGPSNVYESDVNISGQVNNSSNQTPPGQISVTVPSKLGFTVDSAGDIIAATSGKIQNHSNGVDIEVSVSKFIDASPASREGITLISSDTLTSTNRGEYDRSFMSLTLTATGTTDAGQVKLLSENFTPQKLGKIAGGGTATLSLDGIAGNGKHDSIISEDKKNTGNIDTNGISNEFTLTFKIARVSK